MVDSSSDDEEEESSNTLLHAVDIRATKRKQRLTLGYNHLVR